MLEQSPRSSRGYWKARREKRPARRPLRTASISNASSTDSNAPGLQARSFQCCHGFESGKRGGASISSMATKAVEKRARRAAQAARAPPLPLPRARRAGDLGRRVRPALRRAQGTRGGASRAGRPRLADAASRRARGRTASRRCSTSRRWARSRRSQRTRRSTKWAEDVRKRLGTDEPVAYVTEPKIDGLAINLTYEDGRADAGRDARRRRAGRGRDGQPAHDPVGAAARCAATACRRSRRCAARSTCRSPASAS